MHPIDRYMGAVRVPVVRLLSHVEEAWDAIGEDFSLVSDDVLDGLYLNANLTGHPGDGYGVAAWGYFEPLLAELRVQSR